MSSGYAHCYIQCAEGYPPTYFFYNFIFKDKKKKWEKTHFNKYNTGVYLQFYPQANQQNQYPYRKYPPLKSHWKLD